MSTKDPIFILGSSRSGTSALHLALLTNLPHGGYGEGHVFETMLPMMRVVWDFTNSRAVSVPGNFANAIGGDGMKAEVIELYRKLYHQHFGESFIDKTPTPAALQCAHWINEVFPGARVIYMQRRGIEVVLSKRRRFGYISFEEACEEWVDCIYAWKKARGRISKFLEVEQFLLQTKQEQEVARIAAFLELDEQEEAAVNAYLKENDVEKTAEADPLNFATCGMSDGEKAIFLAICGDLMKDEGYAFDESYYVG